METETVEVKVGMTVGYWDMANPYREGVVVEIKKTETEKYLLFGGSSPMEKIEAEATVIWPDSWHRSFVSVNSLHFHEHAGFRLVEKPLKSKEECEKLVAEYERMQPILAEERRRTAEEKQKKEEEQKEEFKKDFSYLVKQEDSNFSSYALGAKNLKTELSRAFPDTKFSVKSEGYSMGCSIDVYWTGGPSREEVEKYANKYKEGWFDGMNDLYNYSDQVWTDVFGGAKYVFCQRRESNEDS